jgi:hypothetical protein
LYAAHGSTVGLYDDTAIANENWDIHLRLARHYRFRFIDKVLATMARRQHHRLRSLHLATVLESCTASLDRLFSEPGLPLAVRAMKSVVYTNIYRFREQGWLQTVDSLTRGPSKDS